MNFYKKHKTIINISLLFLLSRLPMIIFFILYKLGLSMPNISGISFIDNKSTIFLYLYDGAHYLNIAQNGYILDKLFAFFPLYPFLIRLGHMLHISYSMVGILISNIASFISLLVLNDIFKKSKRRYIALALFAFSPILAFNMMCYTESLYLLLTILTFYFYRKKEFLLSGFFLGLSMLTRNTGYILLLAGLIDMIYRYRKDSGIKIKNILTVLFVSLSIGMLYPIYLFIKTGDFLYFSTVQFEYWNREYGFVIFTLLKDIKYLLSNFCFGDLYLFILNWGFFIVGILLSIKMFKKDKLSSIYLLLSTLLFSFTYRSYIDGNSVLPSISLFRYVLSLFPIYLYLPILNIKRKTSAFYLCLIYFLIACINVITIFLGTFLG